MILEHKKQLYGTNWMVDKDSRPFLVYMDDFESVNKRRAVYGLKPIKRPVDLAIGAVKYPLGRGFAKEGDMKELTQREYEEYSRHYLKKIQKAD